MANFCNISSVFTPSEVQTKYSPSNEWSVPWRHPKVFGVPEWLSSLTNEHCGVWASLCISFIFLWMDSDSKVKGNLFWPQSCLHPRKTQPIKKKKKDVFAWLGKLCKEREAQCEMADAGKTKETHGAWPSSEDELRVHPVSAAGSRLSPCQSSYQGPCRQVASLWEIHRPHLSETRMPACFHTVGRIESMSVKC